MQWLIGFVLFLVVLRILFRDEIKACHERDPASTSTLEIMLTYSGLHAIIFYRIAHVLHRIRLPLLPRLVMVLARWLTGIEIHPGARIGKGFFIDHGMGVVIGETTVIKNHVTLFQGVTLGGTGKERGKRHPNLGSHVVVGAGAKVLGNITLGDYSVVGSNAVVVRDVPQNCTVVGVPGRIVRNRGTNLSGEALQHAQLPDPVAERLMHLQKEIGSLASQIVEHQQEDKIKGEREK